MNVSLPEESLKKITDNLSRSLGDHARRFPGESGRRQPVHTVYGGAHLFKAETAIRMGQNAERHFREYVPDLRTFQEVFRLAPAIADEVYDRVAKKLTTEAVEDFRIDFEDGYGIRPDDEEDEHAVLTGVEIARGMELGTLPPFIGLRMKPFSAEAYARSIRTLDLFLTSLLNTSRGNLPDNFVVTLPKIVSPLQVSSLCDVLDILEDKLGIESGRIKVEVMIETTQSIFSADGRSAMPLIFDAARGRCTGAHFGTYDYTADCGISAANQDLLHFACDFARNMMQISFSGTGVFLSDGATNVLPIAPHKGESLTADQISQNRFAVHAAWKLHFDHCRHSLSNGFYQGWDLHPAQIVSRYAAVFSFFFENFETAAQRLKNFVEAAARATLIGDVFDDAATGQGLLVFFLRAINCGAMSAEEVAFATGLTPDDLRSRSFSEILRIRTQ